MINFFASPSNGGIASYRRARERDEGLDESAQWSLLDLALVTERHGLAARCLDALAARHGIEWIDLRTIDAYAAFVASPVGQRWMERWLELQEA